jgi:hypothetical protein
MNIKRYLMGLFGSILLAHSPAAAQKFYPDDPLMKEPPPFQTDAANYRELSELYELFGNLFGSPGERHPGRGVIPAIGVNTMGEVMDGPWFMNRHGRNRLSIEELKRGPGDGDPPSMQEPLRVLTVRKYGERPGLLVHDDDNTLYLLRFDLPGRPEMATGAGMIGSRIMHALGYWVPEQYLITLDRSGLVASPEGEEINAVGNARDLLEEDIDLFLMNFARDKSGNYRATALKAPIGAKLLGPFQFYGTRSDDPNDVVGHEHRRELRGLWVISSWLDNNWISPLQTADALVEEGGVRFFRHYLAYFNTYLGSGFPDARQAREGNEPLYETGQTFKNLLGFGFYAPRWKRASYPGIKSIGRFESQAFEPEKWRPNYDTAALANHLPDDDFWAAKQIMAFTDADLRAIVGTAQYSDSSAVDWITNSLAERRNRIGFYYMNQVLPLDNFRIEGNRLVFDDLAVQYGFRDAVNYTVEWSEFRNLTEEHMPIHAQQSFDIPERAADAADGSYYSARITGGEEGKFLRVYIRKESIGMKVVGCDRYWPGKVLAEADERGTELASSYPELSPRQRELFDAYTAAYNKRTGFSITPEEAFKTLKISERTTFEGVTHALSESELTDEQGNSLGTALDLVVGIERIAGQYYGRQGDEQFRLYCFLRPDTQEVLEKSQEFHFGHANTVYHVGYPHSYRQVGKVPNIQFSVSDDGLKADIDVDYRSSKLPQAMWNGHLTSANSDIRAGNNYDLHTNRWAGIVNWWQELFGDLPSVDEDPEADLLAKEPPEPPTPLPPNRPRGARVEEVHDASQEFLTDWLVRREYDEALDWVSDDALACTNIDDDVEREALTASATRKLLRANMEAISEEMGEFENLTQAIDAVVPWRKAFRLVEHPFEGDFAILEAPDSFVDFFRCEARSREEQERALEGDNLQYGNYYAAMLRFKVANSRGGVIGIVWTKQSGNWRILAWEVFPQ